MPSADPVETEKRRENWKEGCEVLGGKI